MDELFLFVSDRYGVCMDREWERVGENTRERLLLKQTHRKIDIGNNEELQHVYSPSQHQACYTGEH